MYCQSYNEFRTQVHSNCDNNCCGQQQSLTRFNSNFHLDNKYAPC